MSIDELKDSINLYVTKMLHNHVALKYSSPKVVHDSILGTNSFSAFEMAFIDLPIVQRLRRISQIDVASHVFPSGNHNRFEHTLGVATIAGQLINALYKNSVEQLPIDKDVVSNHCRIAAILHDCGHGPFSHLSERFYWDIIKNTVKNNPILNAASAHEILSYYIATSDRLKQFNNEVIRDVYGVNIDLELVGRIIVGYNDDPETAYMTEIVNGSFDSDKLDYILRDSHCTGLKMSLDISRLFYTLGVQKSQYLLKDDAEDKNKNHLSVDISGVTTLEQIVFNKMLLTNSVYHHHKVRAAGCLLRRSLDKIVEYNLHPYGLDLTNPVNLLYLTDDSFYEMFSMTEDDREKSISGLINCVKYRRLPKRAIVISQKTIEYNSGKFERILELEEQLDFQKFIIEAIEAKTRELGEFVSKEEIWIDIPKCPKTKEATTCVIKNPGSKDGYALLRSVFPVNDWVNAFIEYKWKAYVFTLPEKTTIVYKATKAVFEELFDIKFNIFSRVLCKIDDVSNDEPDPMSLELE